MITIKGDFTDSLSFLKKEKKRRHEADTDEYESVENQVWEFLFEIGFNKMNIGRECEVLYGKDVNNLISKRVDVIAESIDARLYVECTTQKDTTTKIKNWISEVEGIRKYESGNTETHNKSIVFIYFTTQEINDPDRLKLKDKGIDRKSVV